MIDKRKESMLATAEMNESVQVILQRFTNEHGISPDTIREMMYVLSISVLTSICYQHTRHVINSDEEVQEKLQEYGASTKEAGIIASRSMIEDLAKMLLKSPDGLISGLIDDIQRQIDENQITKH